MLPKVENPVPRSVGLGSIFSAAVAGGVLLLVAASLLGLPDKQRDAWSRRGVVFGFVAGSGLYLIALLARVL